MVEKQQTKEFSFEIYESLMFSRHHKNNIFPETYTDQEYHRRSAMIGMLIKAGEFEYCQSDLNNDFVATKDFCLSEVYNLFHSDDVLEELILSGHRLPPDKAMPCRLVVPSRCHATSALYALSDSSLTLYTGISDTSNVHSWLVHKPSGMIYETTPVIRDIYFGVEVKNTKKFIEPLVPAVLDICRKESFFHEYEDAVIRGIVNLFGSVPG